MRHLWGSDGETSIDTMLINAHGISSKHIKTHQNHESESRSPLLSYQRAFWLRRTPKGRLCVASEHQECEIGRIASQENDIRRGHDVILHGILRNAVQDVNHLVTRSTSTRAKNVEKSHGWKFQRIP